MILCVNKEEMVGIDYDQATNILKKTEGVINMWVANAARVAGGKPGTYMCVCVCICAFEGQVEVVCMCVWRGWIIYVCVEF